MRSAWLLLAFALAATAAVVAMLGRPAVNLLAEERPPRARPLKAEAMHGDGTGLSVRADPRHRAAQSELPAQRKIRDGQAIEDGGFAEVVWLHTSSAPPAAGQAAASGVCTGTLIAPDAVVTALHCVCFNGLRAAMFGNSAMAADRQWIRLIAPEPNWADCDRLWSGADDLALVRLERAAAGIVPRPLASPEMIDGARAFTIVGFGDTGPGGPQQGVKRGTMVGRVSASCEGQVPSANPARGDSAAYGCRPGREIVAGAMPNSTLSPDTCPGDSGGPLYVSPSLPAIGDPPEAEMRLAGVTSRPTASQQQQCGDGGIYVRLTGPVRTWLEAELVRPVR